MPARSVLFSGVGLFVPKAELHRHSLRRYRVYQLITGLFEVNRDLVAVLLRNVISGSPGLVAGGGQCGRSAGRVSARAAGPEAIISAGVVVAQPVSVPNLPPGSVDAEGKAGKADEDEAEPLRIAEYY
jgi:hypothetical protein